MREISVEWDGEAHEWLVIAEPDRWLGAFLEKADADKFAELKRLET